MAYYPRVFEMSMINISTYEVVLLLAYLLVGFKFAISFMLENTNRKSTIGDIFDLFMASMIMLMFWPLPVVGKIIKDS